MKFVMVGHVDHGKSTLIGRLLADTDSLREGEIEKVRTICQDMGKDFEYAYLLDALQEEKEQGITIDTTSIEFSTEKRNYTIIDAPGHKEFLKNMISGASNAEAAVLIIDAKEGVGEQSKRHAYILSLLGIRQVYVAINKLDLVEYSEKKYSEVKSEMADYLKKLGIEAKKYIPMSAKLGDNVTRSSSNLDWYFGQTFMEAIDDFEKEKSLAEKALRIPIQDIYKFDDRRIIAGKVESGTIKVGDEIKIYPSRNKSRVKTIEHWQKKDQSKEAKAGENTGITIEDEFYFKRGEVISKNGEGPTTSNLFRCNIFWMGKNDLVTGKKYKIKLNTQEDECEVYAVNNVIDSNDLKPITGKTSLSKHDVGNIVIKTKNPLVFDPFEEIRTTGRFVIVDEYDVCGGGIIEKSAGELRERSKVETHSQNISPKTSSIKKEERRERFGHKSKVIWLTGMPGCGKEEIAKQLERELFDKGMNVYYIDASNVRFSLSSDLNFSEKARHEHARRIAEVANMFRNAGFVVLVSIVSPYKKDREYARDIIGEKNFDEVLIDTPLSICKEKNPHGIYTKAEKGEARFVPGIDIEYEKSEHLIKTIHIKEKDFDPEEKVKELVKAIHENVQ